MARAGGGTDTNEDETDDCDDMNPSCLFNEVCHRVAVLYASSDAVTGDAAAVDTCALYAFAVCVGIRRK